MNQSESNHPLNSGHRKSRYDNSISQHANSMLVPFHTQMCDEGSYNEENSKEAENKNKDKPKDTNKHKPPEVLEVK